MNMLMVVFAVSYLSMVIYKTQGYKKEALSEAKMVIFTGILILINLIMYLLT